jgi:hypothetical protein
MITINGGCDKCSKLIQSKAFDPTGITPKLICNDCYNKYYSLETIRDKKLNKVLRKNLKQRIKEWLRSIKK